LVSNRKSYQVPSLGTRPIYTLVSDRPDISFSAADLDNNLLRRVKKMKGRRKSLGNLPRQPAGIGIPVHVPFECRDRQSPEFADVGHQKHGAVALSISKIGSAFL
jgi:hypothetical protein